MRLARYRESFPDAGWARPFEVQNRIQRLFSDLLAPQQAEGLGWTPAIDVLETEAELSSLLTLGCDQVQGYSIAYPMPKAQTRDWLVSRSPGRKRRPAEMAG